MTIADTIKEIQCACARQGRHSQLEEVLEVLYAFDLRETTQEDKIAVAKALTHSLWRCVQSRSLFICRGPVKTQSKAQQDLSHHRQHHPCPAECQIASLRPDIQTRGRILITVLRPQIGHKDRQKSLVDSEKTKKSAL